MTNKTRSKLIYRNVRNYTGDVELARKARSWSDEKIFNELGIKLNKRVPKLVEYTPETYKRRQTEIQKFKIAIVRGYTPQEAYTLKRKSYKQIEPQRSVMFPSHSNTKANKRKIWQSWAKEDDYPQYIKEAVRRVNQLNGFNRTKNPKTGKWDEPDYGWAVVYYAYYYNITIDEAMQRLRPEAGTGGDFYKSLTTLKTYN